MTWPCRMHGGGATSGEPVPENGIQTSGAEVPASGSDPAKAVAVPSDATTAVSVLPVPEARVHTGSRSYGGEIADESKSDNGVSAVEQEANPPDNMNNGSVSSSTELQARTHTHTQLLWRRRRRPSRWDVPPSY
uniref:Uncharacterized protein n=1 Tax=Oryza brachyantha TaxID=4533 RepID=J3MVL3_ORYBR